jgi:uncharacterized protein (DUF2252 family)
MAHSAEVFTLASVDVRSRAERRAYGKSLRGSVPRSSHADWKPAPDRADPLDLVAANERGRVPQLLPIRHARMAVSPFAFYRGHALGMATDLAPTPVSGITTQICGDAHCANFGGFATPEGRVIFDVNDFDETLPGPWEWDVKRLAASLVLAARHNALRERDARDAVLAAVGGYRERMLAAAEMTALERWSAHIDAAPLVALTTASDARREERRLAGQTLPHSVQQRYLRLTQIVDGAMRIAEEPGKVFHPDPELAADFGNPEVLLRSYQEALRDDVRALIGQYRLADFVVKVVGVGSVGTRCGAALFLTDPDDPLFLQIKEALPSVLESVLPRSTYDNPGHRVVAGQRLMQSASDMFLGWTSDGTRSYYVRQLRALKGAPELGTLRAAELEGYGGWCGRALAAAHTRAADPLPIAGYLGGSDVFDRAIADFAARYADCVEADFARFSEAVKAGRFAAAG